MMSGFIKTAILFILSPQCYEEYFTNANFTDVGCFKSTISKCLGLGIIAGSVAVKLPQIFKIHSNKSGDGINIWSVLFDLFAISSNLCYSFVKGFPFSAWGEGLFLSLQTATIALLVLHYNGKSVIAAVFLAAYSSVLYALGSGLTPMNILWSLQTLNVPIIVVGKGLQALSNFKNKSTGQLSAATCWMLFAGSAVRIFTSIQETGDTTIIITYLIASSLNGLIVAQLLYYGGSKVKKSKKPKQK